MQRFQFHSAVARWFEEKFGTPTEPQERGWPAIYSGAHTLIAAPTGSGKTLAAFLASLDQLFRDGLAGNLKDETCVLYVSPLKALSNDIHKNLEEPLAGIREALRASEGRDIAVRADVRTGDTPASKRQAILKKPPHILVTTPESFYLLLTSVSGRKMLATVRTLIVDEIHAVVGNRRGSHLALSMERLAALVKGPLQRVGLSATQKPIEEVARFLVGTGHGNEAGPEQSPSTSLPASRAEGAGSSVDSRGRAVRAPVPCAIIDAGHRRELDLAIELPGSPLEAVMSLEVWGEVYGRLVDLIEAHHTTLIFVNTRRLAERVTHQLAGRLGQDKITSHHGSLSAKLRLDAESRLKRGELKALVATASLELGIDIGSVDLVCQLGPTRSIATFLQRVGRAEHRRSGLPKGRLFPLTRDELVECLATLRSVRRGELDRLRIPDKPLDILAQQIVACAACEDCDEQTLFELMRAAYPYRDLVREEFEDVLRMLADGFSTKRGRRGALIHYDAVNHRVRGRRGARLLALTSGGAIADNADYRVVLHPSETFLGTVNEDFAIESMAGDIFQLGNASWKILQVNSGVVRVEDAHGQPPGIPFWLGEAPARTRELSVAVSELRVEAEKTIARALCRDDSGEVSDEHAQQPSEGERGQSKSKEDGPSTHEHLPLTPSLSPSAGERVSAMTGEGTFRGNRHSPLPAPQEHEQPIDWSADAHIRELTSLSEDIADVGIPAPTGIFLEREKHPAPLEQMTRSEQSYAAADVLPHTRGTAGDGQQRIVTSEPALKAVTDWLIAETSLSEPGARQLADYFCAAYQALGVIPSQKKLVLERFFDESGGMQLVMHAPFGARLNRAWGLALRKRFCRSFNFELQAAATDDAIVLSLGTQHSFPLDEVFRYLNSKTVRDLLVQAVFDSPMFPVRWRWNAARSLALPRMRNGRRVPAPLQRMEAENLMAAVFPDQLACLENIAGDREVPDHPLVRQTIDDCLTEAMDIEGLEQLLESIERGEIECLARDLPEPSPLAHEILNAKPYAFLDNAPLEERRTQAVYTRRAGEPVGADGLGVLDAAAIKRVCEEAWPRAVNADELHEALLLLGVMTGEEVWQCLVQNENLREAPFHEPAPLTPSLSPSAGERVSARAGEGVVHEFKARTNVAGSALPNPLSATPREEKDQVASARPPATMRSLVEQRRAGRFVRASGSPLPNRSADGSSARTPQHDFRAGTARAPDVVDQNHSFWLAAERLPLIRAVYPGLILEPPLAPPAAELKRTWERSDAIREVLRGRMEVAGPTTATELADFFQLPQTEIDAGLLGLEAEGFVLRGKFHPGTSDLEWCDRRLLARIHRLTINRLRAEIQPVSVAEFQRFLLAWQRVDASHRAEGPAGVAAVLDLLDGYELSAAAWEPEVLALRVKEYTPQWLDQLCFTGRVGWGRLTPPQNQKARAFAPLRSSPVSLFARENLPHWLALSAAPAQAEFSPDTELVLQTLEKTGALFFAEIVRRTGLLPSRVEQALGELAAQGWVTADSFEGLRALLLPQEKRAPFGDTERKRRHKTVTSIEFAGRWALLRSSFERSVISVASSDGERPFRRLAANQAHETGPAPLTRPDGHPLPRRGGEGWGEGAGLTGEETLQPGDRSLTGKEDTALTRDEAVEKFARVLLRRYGVMFRRLLERESFGVSWFELGRVYRRLEARGEIRGGHFVSGVSGEQFALPEAIGSLRALRKTKTAGELLAISGSDPLNFAGILTPGPRVTAIAANRILLLDGVPLAALEAGQIIMLSNPGDLNERQIEASLKIGGLPASLRPYYS